MKAWIGATALAGILGCRAAMADDLVIVLQHAAKVAEKLPDSSSQITVIVSVVGAVVGLIALTVAWSQMKIASAKTKLDLYNKRFGVYLAALEYYQDIHSEARENLKVKAYKFIHAFRESKFLFDVKDGIYETLERLQKNGAIVRAFEDYRLGRNQHHNADKDMEWNLHNNSLAAHTEMGKDILTLESQLKAYISFHNVKGWKFFK